MKPRLLFPAMQSRSRWRSPAALSRGLFAASLLMFVALSSLAVGQSEEAPAEEREPRMVGLRGILPAETPIALDAEAWSQLGGNWQAWSEGVAEDVRNLYENDQLNVSQQRDLLQTLRGHLRVMDKSLRDPAYRSLYSEIVTMHGRLESRVDLAEAILDTLELDPESTLKAEREEAKAHLASAIEALDRYLSRIRGGSVWMGYLGADAVAEAIEMVGQEARILEAVQELQRKAAAGESLNQAQRDFLNRPPFVAVREAADRYVAAAQAKAENYDIEALRSRLAELVQAVENYSITNSLADAEQVRAAYSAVREIAVDGGERIAGEMARHYFNYNFRVVASEPLLRRLLSETRHSSSGINEPSSGAWVRGMESTVARVAADIQPSSNGALVEIVLDGQSNSSATASASEATIFIAGNSQFHARRGIRFDGERFHPTGPPTVSVNANIVPTGARTAYDGGLVGFLFGGMARDRAMSEAYARRGQSEANAEAKIRSRVYPEFRNETDRAISELNRQYSDWEKRLRESGLEPSARDVRSSSTHIFMSSRVMRPHELGGGQVVYNPPPQRGVVIEVHESLLNNMFDRINIAGRTMTASEFRRELDLYLSQLFGTEPETPKEEDGADEDLFVFAESDPIRFQIDGGEVNLILRTGIKQQGKEDIPTQVVTVPITFRVTQREIVPVRGSVRVAPAEQPESRATQIVRAGVMRKKIEDSLEPEPRTREFRLKRDGKQDVILHVTRIQALDGWVKIFAE